METALMIVLFIFTNILTGVLSFLGGTFYMWRKERQRHKHEDMAKRELLKKLLGMTEGDDGQYFTAEEAIAHLEEQKAQAIKADAFEIVGKIDKEIEKIKKATQ